MHYKYKTKDTCSQLISFDIDGITRGIVIEWDNPGEYGLAE